MGIPNFITLIRVFLIPVTILFLIYDNSVVALVLFILMALTDALDGFLARILNKRTILGSFLDPMADKLLIVSIYGTLVYLHYLPLWFWIVIFSRDLFLTIGFSISYILTKHIYIIPSLLGKITTLFHILTISVLLFDLSSFYILPRMSEDFLIVICAGLTFLSGLDYIIRGGILVSRNISREQVAEKIKVKSNEDINS